MEDQSQKDTNNTIVIGHNRYILKSKIDEGAYGKVYKIEGENDHVQYALKFLIKGENPALNLIN